MSICAFQLETTRIPSNDVSKANNQYAMATPFLLMVLHLTKKRVTKSIKISALIYIVKELKN